MVKEETCYGWGTPDPRSHCADEHSTCVHSPALSVRDRRSPGASHTGWPRPILSQVPQRFRRMLGFYTATLVCVSKTQAWCLTVSNLPPSGPHCQSASILIQWHVTLKFYFQGMQGKVEKQGALGLGNSRLLFSFRLDWRTFSRRCILPDLEVNFS